MKCIYQKPELIQVVCYGNIVMGSSSQEPPESGRVIDGGVTEGSGGLPGTVGETATDGTTDPYSGHGQGNNGGGSRAKTGMIWDEW